MACLADCIVCTCVLVLCVLRVVGFHTGSTIDQSCHELQMHWCREHAVRPCTFQCLCPSNTFSIRFTLRALLPVSASRQRSGTGLQAFCPSTFYEHGSLSLPSIATSQFLVYSTPSTFTLARIQIGTAHWTSSTESGKIHNFRVESKLFEFTGRMLVVTCGKLCIVSARFATLRVHLFISSNQEYFRQLFQNSEPSRSSSG